MFFFLNKAKIFLYRDNFLRFHNSHNPCAKPNENYPVKLFEVGNDSVSETRVQRLLLNFSPIRARRPRCVTQRSLRGKYCFDLSFSFPLSFLFVFQSLATQSKEIPQRIHWCVRVARVMDRLPISKSKCETPCCYLECANFQVFVSMNVPQILTPWQRLCNNRDINVG